MITFIWFLWLWRGRRGGLFWGVATPAILCHKEPARRIQSPLLGALERWFFMANNRTFPCVEANYTYAIKNQREASKIPRNECEELEGRRREGRGGVRSEKWQDTITRPDISVWNILKSKSPCQEYKPSWHTAQCSTPATELHTYNILLSHRKVPHRVLPS